MTGQLWVSHAAQHVQLSRYSLFCAALIGAAGMQATSSAPPSTSKAPAATSRAPPSTTAHPPPTTKAAVTSTKAAATTTAAPTTTKTPSTTPSTALNPKKGAGMVYFSKVNTALASARLSWTYNWWYDYTAVSAGPTTSGRCPPHPVKQGASHCTVSWPYHE